MEAGAEIVVTRRGQPVARIVPTRSSGERRLTAEQEAAHARSMERLRKGWALAAASSAATSCMTTEQFSLDTNILVYAADVAAGERHERALEILDRAVRRDCVLTLQALAEFFHAATRKQMVARTEAATQLRDWATAFPIVSADPGTLWLALEFAADGRLSLWNALLLARQTARV